jgi:hypothetical protein
MYPSTITGRAARQGYHWRNILERIRHSELELRKIFFPRCGFSVIQRYPYVARCAAQLRSRNTPEEGCE